MNRKSRVLVVCNYNMALYVNSRRRTGTLEVEFIKDKVCYRFSDVEELDDLIESYKEQKEILDIVEDIARFRFEE